MNNIVIVGTHTGIGKTVASEILCEALQADYWKPVQAGSLNNTDSDEVRKLISNSKTVIHPEAYRLT
jgi:dethiobiotin synthetase